MIIFDTLDELESYKGALSALSSVIDVMDHSVPYDEVPGEYPNPGKDNGVHIVDTFISSEKGFESGKHDGKTIIHICLEGEEMVSADGSVFRLSPGRFLSYSGEVSIRRGMTYSSPSAFKSVRFIF